ncbi:MAG: branched-chain amino acid ABC transporter permease [Nostocoides sp.]
MTWLNAVIQGVLLGGLYALFAAGLSLMFGVMRIVNLAHGALALAAAYLLVGLSQVVDVNPLWLLPVVVAVMAVAGFVIELVLLNRTISVDPLPSLLVTFGLAVVLQNVLLEVFAADSRSLSPGPIETASLQLSSSISVAWFGVLTFVLALLTLGSIHVVLARTAIGRSLRATADDQSAAVLSGIRPERVYAVAGGVAFATVALAGGLMALSTTFAPSSADVRLIFAFEAVIIGGLGSLWGTLAGGIVLGVMQTVGAQIDPSWSILAGHLAFLAVLLLRPQGLFATVRTP